MRQMYYTVKKRLYIFILEDFWWGLSRRKVSGLVFFGTELSGERTTRDGNARMSKLSGGHQSGGNHDSVDPLVAASVGFRNRRHS